MKEITIKFYTDVTDESIKDFVYSKLNKDNIVMTIKTDKIPPKTPPKYEFPA